MGAKLELPDDWTKDDDANGVIDALEAGDGKGYRITRAELIVTHDITTNPKDQIRPEGLENEAATGRLPDYLPTKFVDREIWVWREAFHAGDGTLHPEGTVFKNSELVKLRDGTVLDETGTLSADLAPGFTNEWCTTMDREPFEAVIEDGVYVVGPRWRLVAGKYGQDLPGVEIPQDPSAPPPSEERGGCVRCRR